MSAARSNALRRLCTSAVASTSNTVGSNLRTVAKAVLVGPLGTSPEIHRWASGRRSLKLSVGTGVSESDGMGGFRTRTQWNRVFVRDDVPGFDYIARLDKGSSVYIEGQLRVAPHPEGDGSYVNVNVTRDEGVIRVLYSRLSQNEATTASGDSDEPF